MSDDSRPDPESPTIFEARIIDTVSSASDDVRVVIPSFDDGEHAFGPVVWAPRVDDSGNAVFPSDGDWCAVTETDLGSWLILAWTPA